MVKTETIINKETDKPYVSNEGKELVEHKLVVGDEFVPKFASPKKDDSGKYPNYTIVAKVRNSETKKVEMYDGSEELYVTLTPAQYNTLINDVNNGVSINQELYRTYEYHSEEYDKDCIGISCRSFEPAKSFEEIDSESESEEKTE